MRKKKFFKNGMNKILAIAIPAIGSLFIVNGILSYFPQFKPAGMIILGIIIVLVAIPILNKIGFRI